MTQNITEAVLLSVKNWGEADKLVTLFTEDYGKIRAIAYGARRLKSPLAGSIQTFAHLKVALTAGKNLSIIRQCQVIDSFQWLREKLVCTAYGSFITELTAELWPENQPEPQVLELLLAALKLLAERNPRIVAMAAGWQLLSLAGFCPVYQQCVQCGCIPFLPAGFDAGAGGIVCENCNKNLPVCTQDDSEFLASMLKMDLTCPPHFKVSGASLLHCEKFLLDFLVYHLDKKLHSLTFINSII